MASETLINFSYIIASILFIFGLKMLSSAETARRGNMISALGMLIAIVATLLYQGMGYKWIIAGGLVGGLIGAIGAKRVQMTSMPEMVAIFNGFGGIASLLIGWAEYHNNPNADPFTSIAIYLAVLIGGVTFSGSVIAYAKLAEKNGRKTIFIQRSANS